MKLTPIIQATIILSGILLATFTIQNDIIEDVHGITTTGESAVSFDVFNNLEEIGEDMEKRMLRIGDKGFFDPQSWADAAVLFIDVGKYLFELPGVLISVVSGTISVLTGIPIPTWFSTMVIALISITFVLGIVAVFLKRESI